MSRDATSHAIPSRILPATRLRQIHGPCIGRSAQLRVLNSKSPAEADLPPYDDLYSILAAAVGPTAALAAAPTPLGRGLVLTGDKGAQPGHVLLSVDWANLLCVTDNPGRGGNAFGRRMLEDWQFLHGQLPPMLVNLLLSGDVDWATRLAAWLLWLRRNAQGVWQIYTLLLPKEEEMTCLMNYREDEVQELQDPVLISVARKERQQLRSLHDRVLSSERGELRALQLTSRFEDTLWALCMVNSRCFGEKVADEAVSIMAPCCDMANHSSSRPNAEYRYDSTTDCFELVASQSVAAGEQACISYGCVHKSNSELMRDYGFVLPANLNDRVPFETSDSVHSRLGAVQRGDGTTLPPKPSLHAGRLVAALGITCSATGNLELTGAWAPAALMASDDDAAVAHRRRVVTLLSLLPFLRDLPSAAPGVALSAMSYSERQGEQRSIAALQGQCQRMLAAMPTSAQSDEALLRQGGVALTARQRAAVVCRLETKRMLADAGQALAAYSAAL